MKRFDSLRNAAGFTLAELMVVVSLVAILSGAGYSGFSSWQKRERVRSVAYQFVGNLKETRMLAIERRTQYTFGFTANQYTIYIDQDSSGSWETGETVLRRMTVDEVDKTITMTLTSLTNPLIYDIRGIPRTITGALAPGAIRFENEDAFWCLVTLSSLGSVNVSCETDI